MAKANVMEYISEYKYQEQEGQQKQVGSKKRGLQDAKQISKEMLQL